MLTHSPQASAVAIAASLCGAAAALRGLAGHSYVVIPGLGYFAARSMTHRLQAGLGWGWTPQGWA